MRRVHIFSLVPFAGTLLTLALTACQRPPQHGTALLLEVDTAGLHSDNERRLVVDAARDALVRRAERFGAHYSFQAADSNRFVIKVESLPEAKLAAFRTTLLRRGLLEFCLVQPPSSPLLSTQAEEPACRRLILRRKRPDGRTVEETFLLKQRPEMTGGVASALVTRDERDQPQVAFTLDREATTRFAQITRQNINRQLAIVLDGELQTAPIIRSPIESGSGMISGDFSFPEAFALASVLEAPLPAPVKLLKEETF